MSVSVPVKARATGFIRSKRGAKFHTDGHISKVILTYSRSELDTTQEGGVGVTSNSLMETSTRYSPTVNKSDRVSEVVRKKFKN